MTDKTTREQNRISKLGTVVLIMAMLSLVVVLLTSYQDRVVTECQKELNSRFLTVLQERANIADGDREAIRTLVRDLVAADTEKESAQALEKYNAANNALDKARDRVEYPADAELCK